MTTTVLVIDDKPTVRALVRDYLILEGFRVVFATDGREGLFMARQEKPDIILLDVMMPKMNGYDFLRAYRKESDTPIILLTAKITETDKVLGLELGADDYVTKPFGMPELIARIRALLRRAKISTQPFSEVLRVADIVLDKGNRTVKVKDDFINLTPSEFDILATLMTSPGRAFSRAELLNEIQGHSFEAIERTIDVHIRNLRTKIEPEPRQPRYIETVFGIGYRFTTG